MLPSLTKLHSSLTNNKKQKKDLLKDPLKTELHAI